MNEPTLKLHFGPDALDSGVRWLGERGVRRPLVLCGQSRRFVDGLLRALEGVEVAVFDGARVHVPRATVDAARAALEAHQADALISLGGGSATGLAKALRLEGADLPFLAIPTTYSGSEMTRIYGIKDGEDKRVGRELRVRPDCVAYVPEFLDEMPRALSVQSLLNAMAHPISALSRGELGGEARDQAVSVAAQLFRAVLVLAERPQHRRARELAARGTSAAASILDTHPLGEHHEVAHLMGGRFGLPHAAVHSILLPHSLRALREAQPEIYGQLLEALAEADPLGALFDALRIAEAPVSLMALGVEPGEARAALHERLGPRPWVEAAILGRRPSMHVERVAWDDGPELAVWGDLATASDVILAVHGRGATSDSIVVRARECLGDAPGFAIVAPQGAGNAWYAASYLRAWEEDPAAVEAALDTLAKAEAWVRAHAPGAKVHLFGFSQGACLSLEQLAHTGARFDSVAAIAGARLGPAPKSDYGEAQAGVPMVLGKSQGDRWLGDDSVRANVEALRAAGAKVDFVVDTGDAHEISARQRLVLRAMWLADRPQPKVAGFGNAHESEALPGALPRLQNTPRNGPYGLYAEQINGTGFVAERGSNQRSWFYRVRPSAGSPPFEALEHATFCDDFKDAAPEVNLIAHQPLAMPGADAPTDFVDGMHTVGGYGDPSMRRGYAFHVYVANRSMGHRAFYDADGDLAIMPQSGALILKTEMGPLSVAPGQVAIIPRGIKFSVLLESETARGYVGEVFGRHFELPDRGVVGANGTVDERHFEGPRAWFEEHFDPGFRTTAKIGGRLYDTRSAYTPYDVVAWHGNYCPYVYDFSDFSPVSNVAFDHIDPSAYVVLSSPLDERGASSLDLVVFPERWDVTEHTFRPPFFHRNAITEINGIIREPKRPPVDPGGWFLTPSMTAHGVKDRSVESFLALSDEQADAPRKLENAIWFQFETAMLFSLSSWARSAPTQVEDWADHWGRYRSYYDPEDGRD